MLDLIPTFLFNVAHQILYMLKNYVVMYLKHNSNKEFKLTYLKNFNILN